MSLVEAALYVAGRPLTIKKIGSILNTQSKKKIRSYTKLLKDEYDRRGRALEIIELKDGRWTFQLKPQYLSKVKQFATKPLFTKGPLKTLAYIAYTQPVLQSQVILNRGSQSYSHIRELKRTGFITAEKFGKTKLIRITDVFTDYFNLNYDTQSTKHELKAFFSSILESSEKVTV